LNAEKSKAVEDEDFELAMVFKKQITQK